MGIDPETEFKEELQVFGNEVEEAMQCLYAEQTIHNVARENTNVHHALNRNAAFWNLTSRALQANAIIVLGRIFDKHSQAHGVDRLLYLAAKHRDIFSKAALEKRKLPHAGKHTAEFMCTAYVPKKRDFERLQRYADKQRAIYNGQYRALRDKFVAHKERVDMTTAFASASIPRLERLLVFLVKLQDSLWHLFWNGLKPVLRPARYSGRRILRLPLPKGLHRNQAAQEWITRETEKFLKYVGACYDRDRVQSAS
jgi:HEPN superfamily AbiU2-like protein